MVCHCCLLVTLLACLSPCFVVHSLPPCSTWDILSMRVGRGRGRGALMSAWSEQHDSLLMAGWFQLSHFQSNSIRQAGSRHWRANLGITGRSVCWRCRDLQNHASLCSCSQPVEEAAIMLRGDIFVLLCGLSFNCTMQHSARISSCFKTVRQQPVPSYLAIYLSKFWSSVSYCGWSECSRRSPEIGPFSVSRCVSKISKSSASVDKCR
jgi:hypothetical protein